jgi:hypothetical protein
VVFSAVAIPARPSGTHNWGNPAAGLHSFCLKTKQTRGAL